jgi:glycosyltransferase involved in cell wall biosynthesis
LEPAAAHLLFSVKYRAALKIGIDARLLGDHLTGIGHYVSELCREMDQLLPEALFLLYAPWPVKTPVVSPRWRARIDPKYAIFQRFRSSWITKHAWMLLRAPALCVRDRINVFWATEAPFIPRLPPNVRIVASVYDLRYRIAPETQRKITLYMRRLLEKRHARADALITISQGTADKLSRFLGYRAAGIARPAVSEQFYHRNQDEISTVLRRYEIKRPYLLSLANASATPHKNVKQLISVFHDLNQRPELRNYTLVLGGPGSDQLLEESRHQFPERCRNVIGLGYVDEADLPVLYSGADVFVFPSLYEGFGMPVLEARACQTRIVTTDAPELHEAGGDRAVYIRPDAEGIRQGILAALAAERPAGPDNLWTWRDSARILADAIDPPHSDLQ